MNLPAHISDRIRAWVARTSKDGLHVDEEAARHGGVSLMGTLGATWLLRPDGSIWEVDDDFGKPPLPLPDALHVTALVAGVERHAWLKELLPARPADAVDCPECKGSGRRRVGPDGESIVYCRTCSALGWMSS